MLEFAESLLIVATAICILILALEYYQHTSNTYTASKDLRALAEANNKLIRKLYRYFQMGEEL